MPHFFADWLFKGHFDLDPQSPGSGMMKQIRMKLPHVPAAAHEHQIADTADGTETPTVGEASQYREGQFVAAISKLHPVLSLGVSVEKGVTAATASRPEQVMVPNFWDWPRLVGGLSHVLEEDVPSIADAITDPVHVRIRSRDRTITKVRAWQTRAFSFVRGQWFERHVPRVQATPNEIGEHVRTLNDQPDTWVIVHFVRDLSADQADRKSPADIAGMLMQFDGLRRRLRP